MAVLCCAGILWIYTIHTIFSLPDVSHLRASKPGVTAYMKGYNGSKEVKYRWVPLRRISRNLQNAVVIAEDDQFWQHPGFNWKAIKAAARRNWKRRKLSYGGSTITQQLARNLFLSPSKNPFRKFKELLIALKLERALSKERILELYLNVAQFGDGIFGAEAASRHYFGTSSAYLSKHQAAFLAAILPRPCFYESHRNGSYLQNRIASIENRL
jgi:monofunctional biosynthetic peptidoglycan transglycosylase